MKKIISTIFLCIGSIYANAQCSLSPAGPTRICAAAPNNSITLTPVGGGCGTGTWSSSNTGVATVSASGVVTAVGAGTANITFTGSVVRVRPVTVNALPAAGSISPSGTPSVCVGSTLGFTNTTAGPGSIVWTESSATVNATIDASTGVLTGVLGSAGGVSVTVTSTVTDLNGCENTANQNVTVYSLPTVTITSGPSNVCETGTPTATITATPSLGSWSASNANASVGAFTGVVTGVNAGSVNIFYHYTDANNCTNFDTHPMTVDESPTDPGVISGTLFTWPGATTTLSSTMSGGTWSSGTTGVATITGGGGVVTGVTPGTSVMTYSRTNTCGSNSTNVTVTVNPNPTLPSNTPTCLGQYSNITDINTACIYASSTGFSGKTFITAFALWDGTSPYIEVVDNTATGTVLPITLNNTPTSAPDIIIGNGVNANTGPDDYSIAVAYVASGVVYVEIFHADMSSGTLSIASTPAATYTHNVNAGPVRIDGIGDYQNTTPTGYPYYQYAAVAWENLTTGEVYTAEIDLQSTGGGMVVHNIDYGHNPDVAGVIRLNGSTQENWALVTYQEQAPGDKIYVSELNFATPPSLTLQALTFDGTLSGQTVIPRIDANDNENLNQNPGDAYLRVVAAVDNGTEIEIRAYDNTMVYPAYWAISNVVTLPVSYSSPPAYNHYSPSVAMVGPESSTGANDGTAFMTTHFMMDGANNDVVFAEPADVTAPTVLAGGNYYWVSQDPPATSSPSSYVASCAPTCNNIDDGVLVAWMYDNSGTPAACSSGGTESIFYKIGTLTGTTFGFKPESELPGSQAAKAGGWLLHPNPVNNELTIRNTTGIGGHYNITDVLGRTMWSGIIAGSATEVNVSRLAPGTYILKIQGLNGENVVKKFVKE